MSFDKVTRRHFTDAARSAAKEARRRKREERNLAGADCPEVFVIRHLDGASRFRWEIRRFGGVVIDRSASVFPCVSDARSAGRHALSSHLEPVG